ncbi:MAG: hypothetical protein MJH10_20010 [Epibacterium sp.]|nr:hypothetical protein [Epibacterium sp.]NQX75765.1 hypothetical protein [Epibacterium sp.]
MTTYLVRAEDGSGRLLLGSTSEYATREGAIDHAERIMSDGSAPTADLIEIDEIDGDAVQVVDTWEYDIWLEEWHEV